MKRYIRSSGDTMLDDASLDAAIKEFGQRLDDMFRQSIVWRSARVPTQRHFYTCKTTSSGNIRLQLQMWNTGLWDSNELASFVSLEYEQFSSDYYKNSRAGSRDPRTVWRENILKDYYDADIYQAFNDTLGEQGYVLQDYKYSFRPGISNPDYLIFIFSRI